MLAATPPWMNFLLGANDKIVNQNLGRTSYGTPRPATPNAKQVIPSQQGPSIGRMTRGYMDTPTPNMGIGGPALPPMQQLWNPNTSEVY
jgi:hypothetical protein